VIEVGKWGLIILLSFIGLYVLTRMLSSAVFRSYFELRKYFKTTEEQNGKTRQKEDGGSIRETNKGE
jgi:hypothetical protein